MSYYKIISIIILLTFLAYAGSKFIAKNEHLQNSKTEEVKK